MTTFYRVLRIPVLSLGWQVVANYDNEADALAFITKSLSESDNYYYKVETIYKAS